MSYYFCLQEVVKLCPGITAYYLPSEELRSESQFLFNRWKNVLPIPALQKQHVFRRADQGNLFVSRYASQIPPEKVQMVVTEQASTLNEE